MELEVDKKRLTELDEITKQRKQERINNLGGDKKTKKKAEKKLGNTINTSEKYKTMVQFIPHNVV